MSREQQPMRCPECGEDAVHEPPADPVPWEAHGIARPEWSHKDGSSLCPVIGPTGGYQPAQPERKTAQTKVSPARLAPAQVGQATASKAQPGPAQPEPKTGQAQPAAPAGPDPHTARLDPPATLRERLQAELAARTAGDAGERGPRLRAGAAGEIGREHIKRVIARLGDGMQARTEPEPEAGS